MRLPAAAATTAIAGVSVLAAWHTGADRQPSTGGAMAGVSVVAPPPGAASSSSSSAPATTTKGAKAHRSPSGSATTAAPVRRSVTGALVSTPFGNVQVRITVLGSRIQDIKAVHLTDSGNHSVQLSAHAAPILRREALKAQSARIATVSGASYTSEGYRQSLQAAIDQAHL